MFVVHDSFQCGVIILSQFQGFKPLLLSFSSATFPRLSFVEAKSILDRQGECFSGKGLTKQQELALVEYCKSPVFVTHFPHSQRAFYMRRTPDGANVIFFKKIIDSRATKVVGFNE